MLFAQCKKCHTTPNSDHVCDYHRALTDLRTWLSPNDTIYTITRSISRTGMQAKISVLIWQDGRFLQPNWSVAQLTPFRVLHTGPWSALVVNGCGFNRGEHIVECLSQALWAGSPGALKHESL